jgi:hypothetical protein
MQYKEIDGVRYFKPVCECVEPTMSAAGVVLAIIGIVAVSGLIVWALSTAGCTPSVCY